MKLHIGTDLIVGQEEREVKKLEGKLESRSLPVATAGIDDTYDIWYASCGR